MLAQRLSINPSINHIHLQTNCQRPIATNNINIPRRTNHEIQIDSLNQNVASRTHQIENQISDYDQSPPSYNEVFEKLNI